MSIWFNPLVVLSVADALIDLGYARFIDDTVDYVHFRLPVRAKTAKAGGNPLHPLVKITKSLK